MNERLSEWNQSYGNRDNHVFYPHEEIIRFVARHIRKRIGLDEFRDVTPKAETARMLDLGCGIGRHIIFGHEMGLRSYGIDLSDTAIKIAVDWARRVGMVDADQRIRCGDVRKLPWGDNYFDFAVSHGVLDSMPFEMARMACQELARVMVPGGLVYCDLISGDDTRHAREYTGEEVVVTEHEHGTVQSFFNFSKVKELVNDYFLIDECLLIRREDVVRGGHASRYHVVLRKK